MQSEPKINVLLVDDHPENLIALEAILGGLGQNLVQAHSGEEALRCLLEKDFAVILLDVQMPGMDGFETASLIRQRDRSRNTPIIFLTAFGTNDNLMFKGYSLGAVDYLLKPIDPAILTSKVAVFVDLFKKTQEVRRQAAQLVTINAELKQSEERFRLLSRCSPVGIFLTDTVGRCTYTNPNCRMICDLRIDSHCVTEWMQCIDIETKAAVLAEWSACIERGEEYSNEFPMQELDGNIRWIHIHTAPMHSDEGRLLGHVGIVDDITDRKQAESAHHQILQEQVARQQAETANRLKDEFLAIVSHELRTPLNSILGWAQLLLTRSFDEATIRRALQTIERNAKSQAQLIEDILDVSQVTRGKLRLLMQPINLLPIVEAGLEAVRPLANDKSIWLEAKLDSTHYYKVVGDPDRLRQVVWNLLSNAIKFTPAGGRIEVVLKKQGEALQSQPQDDYTEMKGEREVCPTPPLPTVYPHGDGISSGVPPSNAPPPSLTPQYSYPAADYAQLDYAQLQIKDSGIGIHPDFLPHVFDYFRQADSATTRVYGGLGLGLAIVHHLVELHGGSVYASSEGEGKGATFTVDLPLMSAYPELNAGLNSPHLSLSSREKTLNVKHYNGYIQYLA